MEEGREREREKRAKDAKQVVFCPTHHCFARWPWVWVCERERPGNPCRNASNTFSYCSPPFLMQLLRVECFNHLLPPFKVQHSTCPQKFIHSQPEENEMGFLHLIHQRKAPQYTGWGWWDIYKMDAAWIPLAALNPLKYASYPTSNATSSIQTNIWTRIFLCLLAWMETYAYIINICVFMPSHEKSPSDANMHLVW